MTLYIRPSDESPRTAEYVRNWINKSDLPNPFTLEDVEPYGWAVYIPSIPSREVLLENARFKINIWRNTEENNGFSAIGHVWDSTPQSREKLLSVIVSGTNPLGFWTSSDDVDVPVTLQDLQTIYTAMLTKGAQIHARQREMKNNLSTLTDEQLNLFVPSW